MTAADQAGRVADWGFPAPAKLNLFLHVTGRRADGYHLLETVFRFVDWGDSVRIMPRRDAALRLLEPLPGVPPEQDLCLRAARLLQAHTGCRLGADIHLVKRLPLGGGLGGGSSDAATVLLALNRLWGLHLPRQTLQDLALTLGADVPVFVFGVSAFAQGVGEVLQPIALEAASYVVLTPPAQVATPRVFAHPQLTRDTPSVRIRALAEGPKAQRMRDEFRNDLEPVARALHPEVDQALTWLASRGAARMTGSGACVFAPYARRAEAEAVFASRPSHWRGFVADGLDRHPLHAWAD